MFLLFGILLSALLGFAQPIWADSYETPVPMPSPPPAAAMQMPQMPGPASPTLARVYIYRDNGNYQNLSWTAVTFNGAHVGDSAPGTYFYRDVQPGTYVIALRSEEANPDERKTVTVAPGSTTFVKVWARSDYAASVPAVHTRKMHFDGIQTSHMPDIFAATIEPPTVAVPEISRLEPAS